MTDTTTVPRKRKPRGEYAKTGAKRTAILDAALEVFAESGYRSGSMRDVALRVGMSEAGLLHHFPNKSALLAAVLDRRDEHSLERVPLRRATTAPPRCAASSISLRTTPPCPASSSSTASSRPRPRRRLTRRTTTSSAATSSPATAFAPRSRSSTAKGRLDHGVSPQKAAVATIAMMDGLQVQWLLDRESVDMAEELRTFFASFVDIDFDAPEKTQ